MLVFSLVDRTWEAIRSKITERPIEHSHDAMQYGREAPPSADLSTGTAWATHPLAWIPTQAGLSVPGSSASTPDASRITPYSASAFQFLRRQHRPSSRGCNYVASRTSQNSMSVYRCWLRTGSLDLPSESF